MGVIVLGLTLLSLTIWLELLSFWGQFWRVDQQLEVETLMTLDSALRHWQGRGGAWKGRVYPNPDNL